jgi:parallel beta-helix repeat protein
MRRFLSILLALGLALSFSLAIAVPALAVPEVWVDDDFTPATPGWGVDHFATIQAGINAADSPGGIVYVAEGTYNEHDVSLTNGVKVLGAGADVTTINGGSLGSVVLAAGLHSTATQLDGFTVTGGNGSVGGGMFISDSSPMVSNCVFDNNYADTGGGIDIADHSTATVANCIIINNTADSMGGGIDCRLSSNPTIVNNTIVGNTADFEGGGGIYSSSNSSPTIVNNIITGNDAPSFLGGIGGGILTTNLTPPTIDYNDVYGNTSFVAGTENYGGTASAGTHDISQDPEFVGGGDYHLQATSPCIDVGDNSAVPGWLTTDFEGDPRIWEDAASPRVDIGADEYFDNDPPDTPSSLGPTEYVDGSTVSDDTPTLELTQSDPNTYDTVQYTIQIDDDSDFSSPTEEDYSTLLAQGAASFTSSGLPDGDYYWRVMSTDQWGATSGWAVANGGAVAFHLVTSPPPSPSSGAVGGTVYPVDKAALLLPWFVLSAALLLALATGGLILIRRR